VVEERETAGVRQVAAVKVNRCALGVKKAGVACSMG